MAVKYKYPDEAEIVIFDANDYSVEELDPITTLWQATGTYYDIKLDKTRRFITLEGLSEPTGTIESTIIYRAKTTPFYRAWELQSSEGTKTFLAALSDEENEISLSDIEQINPKIIKGRNYHVSYPLREHPGQKVRIGYPFLPLWVRPVEAYTASRYYHIFDAQEGTTRSPIIDYWHPANFTPQYKLNIILDDLIIYSRTEAYSPEYVKIIGQCRDDTCPVLCGDTVCCYGSDGVAVNSFNLSESDY